MKRIGKRGIAILMAFMMMLSTCLVQFPVVVQAAKKPVRLTMNIKNTTSAVGCTVKLKVTAVRPKTASKSVKWSSSNTKVATVSQKGVVKFRKTGTVVIKAVSKKNPKAVAKCKIKVYKATKKMQLIGKKSYTLNKGKSITLKAKVTSPKRGYEPVKWTSKNSKIAKVNAKGKVTAISQGKTVITGKSGNKMVKVTIYVKKKKTSNTRNDSNTDDNKTPDSGENTETPTPNPTPQPTETPTPKPTETPTETPAPEPTETPTPEPTETPDTNACSRETWVSFLVDKLGLALSNTEYNRDIDTDEIIYSYADATDCSNPDKVETALHYGILPEINEKDDATRRFYPNDPVTKEYAAMTLVRALGFAGQQELTCNDADRLLYPKEDNVAVTTGAFSLQDGSFLPDTLIYQSDITHISAWIDGILKAREIDTNHENSIVYKDDVKEDFGEITSYQIKEVDGRGAVVLPKTDATENIKAGDIIVLPANDEWQDGAVIAVSDVSEDEESGTIIVYGEVPDIFDAVEELDLEGSVKAISEEEVDTAKGVKFEDGTFTVDLEEFLTEEEQKNLGVEIDKDGSLTDKEVYHGSIQQDLSEHGSAKAEVKINLDQVDYKLNMKIGLFSKEINQSYITVKNTIWTNVTFSGEGELVKPLGEGITLDIKNTGLSIHIQPKLKLTASGELTIEASLNTEVGIQYCNGEWKNITEGKLKPGIEGKASGSAGAEIEVGLYWFEGVRKFIEEIGEKFDEKKEDRPFVNLSFYIAIKAEVDVKANKKCCTSIDAGPYAELSALDGSFVGDKCIEWGFIQDTPSWDITPYIKALDGIGLHWHLEDGKPVDKCTADTGQLAIKAVDAKTNKKVNKYHITVKDIQGKAIKDEDNIISSEKSIDLPIGKYKVVISAQGYKGYEYTEVINIEAWQTNKLEVKLQPSDSKEESDAKIENDGSTGKNTEDSGSTEPEKANATLRLTVLEDGDADWPVENVTVCAIDADGKKTTGTTNAKGKAELTIKSGTYHLELTADGYEKITTKSFKVNPEAVMVRTYSMKNAPISEEVLKANWEYSIDDQNGQVLLRRYIGESTDVKVGPCYQIKGKVYKPRLRKFLFYRRFYQKPDGEKNYIYCDKLLTSIKLHGVVFPENCDRLFAEQNNLKQIVVERTDMSCVMNMSEMFSKCSSLENLDVSSFDTSKVTDMHEMFSDCYSLKTLDLSSFDTSEVTNMTGMFWECEELQSLNLTSFDTFSVMKYNGLFSECESLQQKNSIKVNKNKWSLHNTEYEEYMEYVE